MTSAQQLALAAGAIAAGATGVASRSELKGLAPRKLSVILAFLFACCA